MTDATPSCAGCHANTKAEYMRDVPPDAPLNATNQLISEKHYKPIGQGADAYKLLSAAEREKLLGAAERGALAAPHHAQR